MRSFSSFSLCRARAADSACSFSFRRASSRSTSRLCASMASGRLRRTKPPTLLYCNPSRSAMERSGSVVVSYSRTASPYFSMLRARTCLPSASRVMPRRAASSGSYSRTYSRNVSGCSPNSLATSAVGRPVSFRQAMAPAYFAAVDFRYCFVRERSTASPSRHSYPRCSTISLRYLPVRHGGFAVEP